MGQNIFNNLRIDHDLQRDLIQKLVETKGESSKRDDLFKKIKNELEYHAKAEERYFYNPLIKKDLTIEKARHSIAEHHEIDELIEDLEDIDYSSPGWLTKAKKLHEKIDHHLKEEEQEVFQLAGKALSETQKIELAEKYAGEMRDLRTP